MQHKKCFIRSLLLAAVMVLLLNGLVFAQTKRILYVDDRVTEVNKKAFNSLAEDRHDWFYKNYVLHGFTYDEWDAAEKGGYPLKEDLDKYSTIVWVGGDCEKGFGWNEGFYFDYFITERLDEPYNHLNHDDRKSLKALVDWLAEDGNIWMISDQALHNWSYRAEVPEGIIIDSTVVPPSVNRISPFFERYFSVKPNAEFYKVKIGSGEYKTNIMNTSSLGSAGILSAVSFNTSEFPTLNLDPNTLSAGSIGAINYFTPQANSQAVHYLSNADGYHNSYICTVIDSRTNPKHVLSTMPLTYFNGFEVSAFAKAVLAGKFGEVLDETAACPAPTGLVFEMNANSQMKLGWDRNPSAAGYNIYRKEERVANAEKLNSAPLTNNSYTDMFVMEGKAYEYTVTSLTQNGVESALSKPVTDLAGRPNEMTVSGSSGGNGMVYISWQASSDNDAIGYNVYRKLRTETTYTKLNSDLITDINYTDDTVQNDTWYNYYLTVIDKAGLESHPSEAVAVLPRGSLPDILLVNGIEAETYQQEFTGFYENNTFTGYRTYDLWEAHPNNTINNYPEDVLVVNQGAIPIEQLRQYPVVMWAGNNYNGDLDTWNASLPAIKQYLSEGGKLVLMSRYLDTYFTDSEFKNTYCGLQGAGFSENKNLTELNPLVWDLQPITGTASLSNSIMNFPQSSLVEPIFSFNGTDEVGGFRARFSADGPWQIVVISGREYQLNQDAIKQNMELILTSWLDIQTGIDDGTDVIPDQYTLWQNYPNPFNPDTKIRFAVPKTGTVTLAVYDILGRQVRTLFEGRAEAGTHTCVWNGKNDAGLITSSGVYFFTLKTEEKAITRKMIFLK